MDTIHTKLVAIQSGLKAPKSQTNSFGKYKYRSCEDILEAVKPLLEEHCLILTISDDIVEVGGRVYVKSTAALSGEEGSVCTTAFAREELEKKGMSESQITGSASSYARKYALNGLFCIDDTKDSDATNDHGKKEDATPKDPGATSDLIRKIEDLAKSTDTDMAKLREFYKVKGHAWYEKDALSAIASLEKKLNDQLNEVSSPSLHV